MSDSATIATRTQHGRWRIAELLMPRRHWLVGAASAFDLAGGPLTTRRLLDAVHGEDGIGYDWDMVANDLWLAARELERELAAHPGQTSLFDMDWTTTT